MLSFYVKFVQTDRQIMVKQYAPDLSMRGLKNNIKNDQSYNNFLQRINKRENKIQRKLTLNEPIIASDLSLREL